MNTFLAALLMAFGSTGELTTNPHAPASFESSLYASSTGNVHLAVNKDQSRVVAVKLLDEQGHVLFKQFVAKKVNTYRVRFDLNELPTGHYQLVVSDGTAIKTRRVDLAAQSSSAPPQLMISIR